MLHARRHDQETLEDKVAGGSSKSLEYAQRISFQEYAILIDGNFTSRHLTQTSTLEAHQANGRRNAEEDQSTSGDGLRAGKVAQIDMVVVQGAA